MPSFFSKKEARPDRAETSRRRRKTGQRSELAYFLETSRALAFVLFVFTALVIGYLSFIGVSTAGPQLLPNQVAPMRITAAHDFSYESRIETERARQRVLRQVPPAFRIDERPYQAFSTKVRGLLTEINAFAEEVEGLTGSERTEAIQQFTSHYNQSYPHRVNVDDVRILLRHTDSTTRRILFENGLITLREVHREGIYAPDSLHIEGGGGFSLLNLVRGDGEVVEKAIQTEEQALEFLRINLIPLNVPQEVSIAMFRIFRPGIVPNVEFDPEKTDELRRRALASVEPVVRTIHSGQSLVEPGMIVSPEQHEMLSEYRRHLASLEEHAFFAFHLNELVYNRLLLVLAVLFCAVIYIRIEDRETLMSNGRLTLLALVAIVNLALVWGIVFLANHPALLDHPEWVSVVPHLAPFSLAPLIVAILIGRRPAIFMALLISFFAGIMFGNRVEIFAVSFLSALCAIWFCEAVRLRKTVVKAAGTGGLVVALSALLLGLAASTDPLLILRQMVAAQLTGLATGIAVAGIIPVLEVLFKRTTDITLLELTDTNHPVLKRMQLAAPGTYHHSLVVANLSENAASAIGANGLLCRVCSIFHDIGKIIKPEYFIENQREGINPHHERSPSFSALVIKSHVKDGVDLAVKYKLPRVVIDVIRQHHGTSLIQYFYHQAKQKEIQENENSPGSEVDRVSESTYRYDGPKPQFKESAIILFADSIEAASRSLKKISTPNVDELIETIVTSRIEDGQLDECPLTMQEIAQIKKSFSFTLLNMLHSRIGYPGGEEKGGKPGNANDKAKKDSPEKPVPQPQAHVQTG